ncbi:MAG: YggS family pyridoxal phosphate-dependent enzyme [Spirochaetes bacterium]|nr:YggS family pyridoxal phosphate-dependent enzyme [Spirochaetota bacterium]
MRDNKSIKDTIESLQLRVEKAALRAGRLASSIEIMAVTKFQPIETVRLAYTAGIRIFGENRIQEAASKYGEGVLGSLSGARLDMIGQLQRNKINKALELFDSIQSIGSSELLEAILERFKGRDSSLGLYFELHTGEATKSGFASLNDLLRAVEHFLEARSSSQNLKLKGLMTMAPFTGEKNLQRKAFRTLADASLEIRNHFDIPSFGELSMGMSADFETAIEEGSTMVRIGTALFGEKKQL